MIYYIKYEKNNWMFLLSCLMSTNKKKKQKKTKTDPDIMMQSSVQSHIKMFIVWCQFDVESWYNIIFDEAKK